MIEPNAETVRRLRDAVAMQKRLREDKTSMAEIDIDRVWWNGYWRGAFIGVATGVGVAWLFAWLGMA